MSAVIDRVRTDRRVAIGLVVAILFLVAWIAWTVHVWNENGSDAGLGVLVSWPAVLAALALIASPFVAVAWLLRSRDEGEAAGLEHEDEAEDDKGSEDEEGEDEGERDEDADADPEPAKKAKAKRKAKSKTS